VRIFFCSYSNVCSIQYFVLISSFLRERVWVDPFKIGKLAAVQKISKAFSGGQKKAKSVIGNP
jgi:hypothetical protein